MADATDVQNTLAALIAAALYPGGFGGVSAVGSGIRIMAGWPSAATLDADLRAGIAQVSIFASKTEKNTTRYPREWEEINRGTRTITATVAGTVVTLGGSISTPQNVALHCTGKVYTYAVQSLDSLATVASALALLVSRDRPATSSGSTVTIPSASRLKVNVGVGGTMARFIRHQEKQFTISVWAPTPTLRSSISQIIDVLLSSMNFLELPDLTSGRIIYQHSFDADETQKEICYRRDLTFSVDYPTIELTGADEIVTVNTSIDGGPAPDGRNLVTTISRG